MSLVPMDDRDGSIWWNGAMVPWRQANLHVLTHGLHYGSGVFEGERVYGGRVFKLREHTERLHHSASVMDFELPYSADEIDEATLQVIKDNNITDGYVRPIAWRGSEQMGVSAQRTKINLAIACWEWPSYFSREARERGIRLATSNWRRPAPDTAPTSSKACGLYMICTLSKHQAERAGFDDALMLDYRGQLAEATGANLFLVIGGALHTPKPDCFLDGITRRTVIDLARERGIEVIEREMFPQDLALADEVFLTGTAVEVTAVGGIDEHRYQVGPVTRQLRDAYERLVRDCVTCDA